MRYPLRRSSPNSRDHPTTNQQSAEPHSFAISPALPGTRLRNWSDQQPFSTRRNNATQHIQGHPRIPLSFRSSLAHCERSLKRSSTTRSPTPILGDEIYSAAARASSQLLVRIQNFELGRQWLSWTDFCRSNMWQVNAKCMRVTLVWRTICHRR